ncbi:MAG TPA: hypothetical protein VK912_03630 [Longimicrobiales bacterium]|nr:hypothetical protein [Longimicrobiales bacterium]
MSYGLFTVLRTELARPQLLLEKLELATGNGVAAERLTQELAQAAAADSTTDSWHVVPSDGSGEARQWRVEPTGP